MQAILPMLLTRLLPLLCVSLLYACAVTSMPMPSPTTPDPLKQLNALRVEVACNTTPDIALITTAAVAKHVDTCAQRVLDRVVRNLTAQGYQVVDHGGDAIVHVGVRTHVDQREGGRLAALLEVRLDITKADSDSTLLGVYTGQVSWDDFARQRRGDPVNEQLLKAIRLLAKPTRGIAAS